MNGDFFLPPLLNNPYCVRGFLLVILLMLIGIDYWSSYYLVNNNPHIHEMNPLLAMTFEQQLPVVIGFFILILMGIGFFVRVLDLIWKWGCRKLGRRIPDLVIIYLASSIIYYSLVILRNILVLMCPLRPLS